ncbi:MULTISPECIES: hypothetical protein [Halococcus]|nr:MULTISPECIES: hypothetical protein [Halococcus]
MVAPIDTDTTNQPEQSNTSTENPTGKNDLDGFIADGTTGVVAE